MYKYCYNRCYLKIFVEFVGNFLLYYIHTQTNYYYSQNRSKKRIKTSNQNIHKTDLKKRIKTSNQKYSQNRSKKIRIKTGNLSYYSHLQKNKSKQKKYSKL